jgi:hypothetical protein
VLPKSSLEAEVKQERKAYAAPRSQVLAPDIEQQIQIEEQAGEESSLQFCVDTRSDVKVSPCAPTSHRFVMCARVVASSQLQTSQVMCFFAVLQTDSDRHS